MRLPLFTAAVLALAAGPALAADPPAAPPVNAPDATVAATVNGEVIRLDEVDARIKARPGADAPLTAAQGRQLRLAALDDLIDERLLAGFLKARGPKPDPAEVDRHLAAMAEALKKQGKTVAGFAKEIGLTESQLRQAMADRLLFQKHVEPKAADDELRKYHATYKDHFDGVAVTVSHIVGRAGPGSAPGEWAAARQKLAAVRADIVAGKITFAEAARKYSLDASAPNGGALGLIRRRDSPVDEAFCRAAFAQKVGEVSQPVDCEFGVHLILVTARTPGTPRPFEQVADEVRDCYTEDVRENLVAQLRKAATVRTNVP